MMYTWVVSFLCAGASVAPGTAAALRPSSAAAQVAALDPDESTDIDPPGWVKLEHFQDVQVEEYRTLHPENGRVVLIGTRTLAGVAHGPEWSYWPNGAPRIQRVWVDGHMQGPYKAWFTSGMRRLEGLMKNDGRDGPWHRYSEKSHLTSLSEYQDGVPHGAFREFYASGKDKSERHFDKGVQVGVEARWSGKGKPEFEAHWEAGELHGPWKRMALAKGPAGPQGTYSHGKREGIWIEVTHKGVTISEVAYVDGVMEGVRKTWRADGTLATEAYQEHGKETGPFSAYHVNGNRQMTGEKVDGQREGMWTYWKADGSPEPVFSGTYENDVKVAD
ncbi:MAG: antitoxin component YwqK of YwqJK toxin-antitoxin module [Chlamydiales bacterium]|jgi:antitoxin component YwqK of YwqJK toxin-antitoxin module